jgi:hypothetical protein
MSSNRAIHSVGRSLNTTRPTRTVGSNVKDQDPGRVLCTKLADLLTARSFSQEERRYGIKPTPLSKAYVLR